MRMAFLRKATSSLLKPNIIRYTIAFNSQKRYAAGHPGSKDNPENSTEIARAKSLEEDIPEEEFTLNSFSQTQLVPEVPIASLNIEKRINKVTKKGSFSADIFTGGFDHDFLTYPEPLYDRSENQALKDQAKMVRQLYPQVWDDERQLQKFNFYNLFQLSATEMMTIFEAIGESSRKSYEFDSKVPSTITQIDDDSLKKRQVIVAKSIVQLITRNCLTYWPMSRSDNYKIKMLLPQKHILYGGSSDLNDVYTPIGFCWTEQANNLGALPPQEWLTQGQDGGPGVDHLLIKGKKTRVLHDESVENYLIFYRDKFLSEKYEQKPKDDEPNPASDPFAGCCLLHKSELKFGQIYQDSAGFEYKDVEFDTIVPKDRLVFAPARRDPKPLNIKALGQVASCSVTLGILKDTLRRTYKYLLEEKRGLLSCDIIERKLAVVTSKIYAIETMVYYIAGMFDGLEDGFDAHLEAIILKIVTNEYAFEVLQDLQQICGSEMFILSRILDQINIFDSFLDGNIYNRLYLATLGVIWFARSKNMHLNQLRLAPWYPGYFIKTMMKQKSEQGDWLTLGKADIYGNLHPSLHDAGLNLEYILKRVSYATECICSRHGSDVTGAQSALYSLAQLSIDSFMLTTLCARASKSYCNGSRNCDIDIAMATTFSDDLARKVKLYIEQLQIERLSAFQYRAKTINELNLKLGGYYAESPLDPNV